MKDAVELLYGKASSANAAFCFFISVIMSIEPAEPGHIAHFSDLLLARLWLHSPIPSGPKHLSYKR